MSLKCGSATSPVAVIDMPGHILSKFILNKHETPSVIA